MFPAVHHALVQVDVGGIEGVVHPFAVKAPSVQASRQPASMRRFAKQLASHLEACRRRSGSSPVGPTFQDPTGLLNRSLVRGEEASHGARGDELFTSADDEDPHLRLVGCDVAIRSRRCVALGVELDAQKGQ